MNSFKTIPITQTIIKRSVYIAVTLGLVVLLWVALVAQGAAGSTFATGQGQSKLELTISSSAVYNDAAQPALNWSLKNLVPGVDRFFDFNNLLPGDEGTHRIGVRVEKNAAYACLDFTNLVDDENDVVEPELLAGDITPDAGELSQYTNVFAWRDSNGDGIFTTGEEPLFGNTPKTAIVALNDATYPLADASTGTVYDKNSTNYLGFAWCVGVMTVDLSTGEIACEGEEVGNIVQTDSMTLDVTIRAVAAIGRPGFYCRVQDVPLNPGQCPAGYDKIVDGYNGGLSWTATGDYTGVVLAGGPPGENNQDPDGRSKYFYGVAAGDSIAREAHDISYICATTDSTLLPIAGTTEPESVALGQWEEVLPKQNVSVRGVGQGLAKRLGL